MKLQCDNRNETVDGTLHSKFNVNYPQYYHQIESGYIPGVRMTDLS